MKTLVRSVLAPFAVVALAGALAWLFLEQQERKARRGEEATAVNSLAARITAIDAAKKAHRVVLEAERRLFEQEKKEAEIPELAELSHEVRMLRIELEHNSRLAEIDRKFPPPNPWPEDSAPLPLPAPSP